MSEQYVKRDLGETTVSIADRIHFRLMSLVHEDLYKLFRDPYKVLEDAGLASGQKVLEVGCGPGFFTVPASRIVGEQGSVYAVDISPIAVEKVQRKIREAGATNARVLLADAAETGLTGESFDLVFVFGFANPAGNEQGIWDELQRLLKPGGVLSIEGRLQPSANLFNLLRRRGRITQFEKVG